MRKKQKNTLDKQISCWEVFQCQQLRWGSRAQEVGDETGKRHKEARATLTRGGPHTSCPELPQDEALLTLSQRQEEFIGFYALLTETEAHGILNGGRGPGASSLQCCSHQLLICLLASLSSKRRNTLDKARGSLFCDVYLPH